MRREYDFEKLSGKTRGKYAGRFANGVTMVLLEPDVAAAFPDAKSANESLRLAAKIAKIPRG